MSTSFRKGVCRWELANPCSESGDGQGFASSRGQTPLWKLIDIRIPNSSGWSEVSKSAIEALPYENAHEKRMHVFQNSGSSHHIKGPLPDNMHFCSESNDRSAMSNS